MKIPMEKKDKDLVKNAVIVGSFLLLTSVTISIIATVNRQQSDINWLMDERENFADSVNQLLSDVRILKGERIPGLDT